jgi:hypothetical protein
MPDEAIREHEFGILRDVVLFGCSVVITWVISFWFAKRESNEKIDTIAERSFEKISMLTLQIERAKNFLNDTIKLAQSDAEREAVGYGMAAYKHRINGCIATLDQISTSNDTFRADWLGVVSPEMKKTLSQKMDALQSLPGVVSELAKQERWGDDRPSEIERKIETVERSVPGAGKLLDEIRAKSDKAVSKVAVITQRPDEGNSELVQSGRVVISVRRRSLHATASARFEPVMSAVPEIEVSVVSLPEGASEDALVFPGRAEQNQRFNIHLGSADHVTPLPLGDYEFAYQAKLPDKPAEGEASSN